MKADNRLIDFSYTIYLLSCYYLHTNNYNSKITYIRTLHTYMQDYRETTQIRFLHIFQTPPLAPSDQVDLAVQQELGVVQGEG